MARIQGGNFRFLSSSFCKFFQLVKIKKKSVALMVLPRAKLPHRRAGQGADGQAFSLDTGSSHGNAMLDSFNWGP